MPRFARSHVDYFQNVTVNHLDVQGGAPSDPLVMVVPTVWQLFSRAFWPCCVAGIAIAVFTLSRRPSFAVVAVPFCVVVLYGQLRVLTRYCELLPDGTARAKMWTSRIVEVKLRDHAVISTPHRGMKRRFIGWTITDATGTKIYLPPFPLNAQAFLEAATKFGAVIEK